MRDLSRVYLSFHPLPAADCSHSKLDKQLGKWRNWMFCISRWPSKGHEWTKREQKLQFKPFRQKSTGFSVLPPASDWQLGNASQNAWQTRNNQNKHGLCKNVVKWVWGFLSCKDLAQDTVFKVFIARGWEVRIVSIGWWMWRFGADAYKWELCWVLTSFSRGCVKPQRGD